jgi:hypothetical protein
MLPIDNPIRKAIVYAQGVRRYASPLDTTLAAVTGRLRKIASRPLSENPPWVHATWAGLGPRVVIAEREQAIKDANEIARAGRASLYSDASATAQKAAIAVARRRENNATVVLQESIGWTTTCDILTAEIAVISAALEYI